MGAVKRTSQHREGQVLKGLAAGVVGGLVASWTMNQFQELWTTWSEGDQKAQAKKSSQTRSASEGKQKKLESEEGGEGQDATVKAASEISEGVFDHKLTKSEKKVAGPAVHYAMGATSGAIYGVMAELLPPVTMGAGLPFGTAVWLIADEAALPALGLSKSPAEVPLSTHAYALASHFVYGLTTEIVRKSVRGAL